MSSMTSQAATGQVFAGVDTHKSSHQVAVVDEHGRVLEQRRFGTDGPACREVSSWLTQWPVARVGIEQTGTYGAELTRVLSSAGFGVVEVDRPDGVQRSLVGAEFDLPDGTTIPLDVAFDRRTDNVVVTGPDGELLRVQIDLTEGPVEPMAGDRASSGGAISVDAEGSATPLCDRLRS